MKYKYLESYHLTQLQEYCKKKCISIVINHHNEDSIKIDYYRGLYGGYLYGKQVTNFLKLRKKSITNFELYNHFKYQKNWRASSRGMQEALYDIMNQISISFSS